jgi:AmiR/NasT family two-component response regulator
MGRGARPVVDPRTARLSVLIANERPDRQALLADLVTGLGHVVTTCGGAVEALGAVTARERPDVVLVGLDGSVDRALDVIERIVHTATCPVIAVLAVSEPEYVREAARRGVFACIVDSTAQELQTAIDVTLRRFGEFNSLQGAFGRRALIEQAKGILMARHSIDATKAFEMLRAHSRHGGQKLVDVSAALIQSHRLMSVADQTAGSAMPTGSATELGLTRRFR